MVEIDHLRVEPYIWLTLIFGEPSPLSSLTAPLEPSDSYRARWCSPGWTIIVNLGWSWGRNSLDGRRGGWLNLKWLLKNIKNRPPLRFRTHSWFSMGFWELLKTTDDWTVRSKFRIQRQASVDGHIHDGRSHHECADVFFWSKAQRLKRIEMKSHIETKLGLIQLDH